MTVKEYFLNNLDSNLEDALIELGNYKFEACDWGSCQYSKDLALNTLLHKISLETPDKKRFFEFLHNVNLFDIKVIKLNDFNEAIAEVKKGLEEIYLEDLSTIDSEKMNGVYEDNKEAVETIKVYFENNKDKKRIDFIFEVCKDLGWDLWATASFILPYFIEVEINTVQKIGVEEGLPLINQMIHDTSLTGLECFLLEYYGLIEDSSCFDGFST